MIDTRLSDTLINMSLEEYNITIQEIRKESPEGYIDTGVVKNKKPVMDYWYNKYTWIFEEHYNNFRKEAEELVLQKGYTKEDLDFWECLYAPKADYLPFNK